MSLAAETRAAVRRHPFVLDGLRAGVVNYTAAARYLDVEGDEDAVATALRRFAEDLSDGEEPASSPGGSGGNARVTMESGLGETDAAADALLAVGDVALAPDEGSLTGVLARGDVGPVALERALARLRAAEVDVVAAGVGGEALVVAVERLDGADALRVVEDVVG